MGVRCKVSGARKSSPPGWSKTIVSDDRATLEHGRKSEFPETTIAYVFWPRIRALDSRDSRAGRGSKLSLAGVCCPAARFPKWTWNKESLHLAFIAEPDRSIRVGLALCELELALRELARKGGDAIA